MYHRHTSITKVDICAWWTFRNVTSVKVARPWYNVQCILDTAPCKLDTAQCALDTAQCTRDTVQCTLQTAQWALDTAQGTLDTAQCTPNTEQCTLNMVHCRLNTAHWWNYYGGQKMYTNMISCGIFLPRKVHKLWPNWHEIKQLKLWYTWIMFFLMNQHCPFTPLLSNIIKIYMIVFAFLPKLNQALKFF